MNEKTKKKMIEKLEEEIIFHQAQLKNLTYILKLITNDIENKFDKE